MGNIIQTLSDYWHGRKRLVTVIIILLVAGFLSSFFPTESGAMIRYTQSTLIIIIALWLTTGAMRTTTRIIHERPGAISIWGIYGAIATLLVLTAIQVASLLFPASAVIEPVNTTPPKVTRVEDNIYIKGEIDYRILVELRPFLSSGSPAKTIWMRSNGGNVIAGRSIGLAIERAGLDTKVDGTCYSACTLIFAGGHNRFLPDGAALGFHGYRLDHPMRVRTVTSKEIQVKDRVYLARRGISSEFLDKVYKVAPQDIWIPTRDTLLKAGVITQ